MTTDGERHSTWSGRGAWTREPAAVHLENDGSLRVEAVEGSDWWQDTADGFRHENGHALLEHWPEGTAVEVTFELDGFTGQFDQAGRVDDWMGSAVTVRASRIADAVVIRARSSDDPEWRLVRVARFPHESALIGPMLCAPTRSGLRVRFVDWRVTAADTELHADPEAGESW